jgi:CubicO group peptidase (beta-lactamase class C family)
MATVDGTCDRGFEGVRAALGELLDSGRDVGASVAVIHEGVLVADLWGGHTDVARTTRWRDDTIVNIWSTTKTMCNLCALVLADVGALDLDAPVARYWPEFRAAGKDAVLVRHVLGHTAGLPSWRMPLATEDLYDWEKVTSLLARDEPWWEPGTASGYHSLTQGYLVGELVRRVTGQSLGAWFKENLAEPLAADIHIGTPPSCDARVAPVIPPPEVENRTQKGNLESITARAANPPVPAEVAATVPWRRAEIPAGNGHGNARSVALVQSIVSGKGETHRRRFMSAAGCDRIFEEQAKGVDLVIGIPIRFGMGYGLPGPDRPYAGPRSCYWGGRGGSLVVNDQEHHLTVAYVMNKMRGGTVGDDRAGRIVAATYQCLAAAGQR